MAKVCGKYLALNPEETSMEDNYGNVAVINLVGNALFAVGIIAPAWIDHPELAMILLRVLFMMAHVAHRYYSVYIFKLPAKRY